MRKVVINVRFGGFSISKKAAEFMANLGCERAKKELEESTEEKGGFYGYGCVDGMDGEYDRESPYLIQAVETLKDEANGMLAELKVVEIPDDVDYYIHDYDGVETIHEKHRTW